MTHYDLRMSDMSWWSYVKSVAGTEDGRTIARAAGVSASQVSRWRTGKHRPDADQVIRFARHYHRSPVEALVAAEYIAANEVKGAVTLRASADDFSTAELLEVIGKRAKKFSARTDRPSI